MSGQLKMSAEEAKAVVRREAAHALNLHLQNCAVLAEAYRRK